MAISSSQGSRQGSSDAGSAYSADARWRAPEISFPKGGGAIGGIGEKFSSNPANGTGGCSVPIAASPGRQGFAPDLTVNYDSGAGNGPFGFGWSLSLARITRRTDKGLPQYGDQDESDIFLLSGQEDLVRVLDVDREGGAWSTHSERRDGYAVVGYRPRTEGLFARIERWTRESDGSQHWRTISRDDVLTLYGPDESSRIADPNAPHRVFSWLMRCSFDGKGNAILYEFEAENDAGVEVDAISERHRSRAANRYLKCVRYGNHVPLNVDTGCRARWAFEPGELNAAQWMFSVVFDYQEGRYVEEPADTQGRLFAQAHWAAQRSWAARADPFSSYRAGFEVRTHRLCARAMAFHHFPEELGAADCLVRSTAFSYREGSDGSFLEKVIQRGHKRQPDGHYLTSALPSLDFGYSRSPLEELHPPHFDVVEVDPASLRDLPGGLDGGRYRWLDLNGEGVSGLFSEQGDAWLYKRNLGGGRFASAELTASRPVGSNLQAGQRQFLDIAGDGKLDLVDFAPTAAGYYEREPDAGWAGFRAFRAMPALNWADPNLRFLDLTGDGVADILITEEEALIWHPSLLQEGFGSGVRLRVPYDEESGPAVIFADGTQSIYTADMTGDGLSDLVRIRNGEVCYWPNRGYGHFGAKVGMDGAPWFDEPDGFDQKRIRLADADGSGTTDIFYLRPDGVDIYLNLSGNGWSAARRIEAFAPIDDLSAVSVVDFLGRGTACLLWSTPLPAEAGRQLRYVDLMGGRKPHLLTRVANNLGAETQIEYASSTEFYLADEAAGTPWITRLPFPVHVVERVETRDLVSGNSFVTRYAYHHGFFDGLEREFRGFARVDQWDTEDIPSLGVRPGVNGEDDVEHDQELRSSVPPVFSRTWFHTGVYLSGAHVSRQLAHEYFGAGQAYPDADDGAGYDEPLEDTILPDCLTPFEAREACRALKGALLRKEIYALDGTAKAVAPYSIAESNFTIRRVQPKRGNRYAVFFTHPRESVTYDCERDPRDPRVTHSLTLAVDDYGNVLKAAQIGYGRRDSAFEPQTRTLATLAENRFTNVARREDAYRAPLPAQIKTYELTAPQIAGARRLHFAVVRAIVSQAEEIPYEAIPNPGRPQKRRLEETRTLYRSDDLSRLLPLGALEALALPGEAYKQCLTPGLLALFRTKASENELGAILGGEAGYVDLEGDGSFWAPSGRIYCSPSPESAAAELAFARAHFFLGHRYQDPFGATTSVRYDSHDLLASFSRDAVGNETRARYDYRVLQPEEIVDANDNRSRARFDALGLLAGTVVQGKADGPLEGDTFDAFEADPPPDEIRGFFDAPDPTALAHARLGTATTRILYDLARTPVCAASIARETHVADLVAGQQTRVQLRFAYSDGFGRIAQTRTQAEPGPLHPNDPNSPFLNPRWVGAGATIYNNKGKPVRRYEPFFCKTPQFGIERWGVSDVLFYDPLLRVVATLHPNATYEKVVFDSWRQATFDANDTATFDPASDPDVGAYFRRLPQSEYLPTWLDRRIAGAMGRNEQVAAEKAAGHADTPTIAHFDALGRPFLSVADNGRDEQGRKRLYDTLSVLDIEGNQRAVIDALGRIVVRYAYDMARARLHQASMEAGERWTLGDVAGKPVRAWNSRGYAFRIEYDLLRRPLRSFVSGGDAQAHGEVFAHPTLFTRTIYGDSADTGLAEPDRRAANLRNRVFRHFDGAGSVTTDLYDFKGNGLRVERQFARAYKTTPDWSRPPELEPEVLASASAYDALNRAIAVTAPDRSVYRPTFNDAGLLEKVDVNLRAEHRHGRPVWTPFVEHINYDAKGQRTFLRYANGATTTYVYDEKTFRLTRLTTTRAPRSDGLAARLFRDPAVVQDLRHTFDPVGNITRIEDEALRTTFHANQRVEPASDYSYDPLYRLVEASGREHVGQSGFARSPRRGDDRDYPLVGAADLHDLEALSNYVERYDYDPVGNFRGLRHLAARSRWTRDYVYEEASLIDPTHRSNRLSHTILQTNDGPVTEPYAYDAHGNIVAMPHLPTMAWDFKDALAASARQQSDDAAPEMTYYVYDAAGQRARKITERRNGSRKNERLYLGGFELYREFDAGGGCAFERQTLHIMDDIRRIALIETLTREDSAAIDAPKPALRYQFANHLGSACLELDDKAQLISYEEYTPYGTSAFQAGRSAAEVSLKRYRYTGKERDEENGFTYHGARYYAPWIARWTACDPEGIKDGANIYEYVNCRPTILADVNGREGIVPDIIGLITFEVRQAAFEAGKLLETGLVTAQMSGGVSLQPPRGQSVLDAIAGDRMQRLAYATAQGNTASTILRNNLTENSANATWGEASQKLVPELAFSEGSLISVGKNPGGEPDLARTADIGIAKAPTSPVEWDNLTQDSFEDPLFDMKVSNSYVRDKVGFEEQSGGLSIEEVRPWSRLPPRPRGPSGVAGLAFALVTAGFQSNSPKEFAGNTVANVLIGKIPELGAITGKDDGSAMFGLVVARYAAPAAMEYVIAPVLANPITWVAAGEAGVAYLLFMDKSSFMGDQKLADESIAKYRAGENVNAFCAQCHGKGGALDPDNKWNLSARYGWR
jgi:RHS repeat-associated protein